MDIFNNEEKEVKPEVLINSNPWSKKNIALAASASVGVLFFSLLALNFLGIISYPAFLSTFLYPKKLTCPIQNIDCNTGKQVEFQKNPAVSYNLPEKSKIVAPIEIVDTKQFVLAPYKQDDPIGLYQSFILGNDCYTISYIVPSNAQINKIGVIPLIAGSQLITLSSDYIKIGNENANLILQLQKRSINKSPNTKTESEKCPVYNVNPQDFGQYVKIDQETFK